MIYRRLPVLLLILLSTQVQATIINHNWYTTDTESNLDWLDVTKTQGVSYNDMVIELESDGLFNGWRFATINEVRDLLTKYTGINSSASTVTYQNNELDGLIDLLNPTIISNEPDDFYRVVVGFFDNSQNPGQILQTALLQDSGNNPNRYDWSRVPYHQSLNRATEYEGIGSFLVRNMVPVPEPSILALFTLGLLGFGFTQRKTQ